MRHNGGRLYQDVDSRLIIQAKTIYKLNPTIQTQDNAVLLQTTVMWGCGF